MRINPQSPLYWILISLLIGAGAAALDPAGQLASSWWAYPALAGLGGVALWGGWRAVAEAPTAKRLPLIALLAVGLRLGAGIGLARALPTLGYENSSPHQAGYYYEDAYLRDGDAWELASSGEPLWQAFTEGFRTDQYGGLVFLSAATYRALSPEVHRPTLIALLSAYTAGLGVLFGWGFAARHFGDLAARVAAWTMALYPEAILLSSAPMREPFLITALAMALYGLGRLRGGGKLPGLISMSLSAALALVISPPYLISIVLVLLLAWIWTEPKALLRNRGAALALLLVAVVGGLLTIRSWESLSSAPRGNLPYLIEWWLSAGANFELNKLEQGSGWVQKLFEATPQWAHAPMAAGNGLVQPFLPAAIMDSTSKPFVRVVGIWRSLGWFVLLPFLIYAPFAALRRAGWRSLQFYFSLVVWLSALLASYRLAGDQWDNPRARTVFLVVQAALAGWAWAAAKANRSPWLGRVGIVIGVATLLFLQWYAGRYYHTPQLNLTRTVVALAAFVVLFIGGALAFDRWRARKANRLTEEQHTV